MGANRKSIMSFCRIRSSFDVLFIGISKANLNGNASYGDSPLLRSRIELTFGWPEPMRGEASTET